jgi:hypothetical protein
MVAKAYANNQISTEVTYNPISTNGVTTGCSLKFTALVRDTVYNKGNITGMSGGISLVAVPEKKTIAYFYKSALINSPDSAPQPPHFMFLKTSDFTTAKSKFKSHESDLPGFRLWLVEFDEQVSGVMTQMLEEQKLVIGYNLRAGGTDAFIELDLSQKESWEATKQYVKCLPQLYELIK